MGEILHSLRFVAGTLELHGFRESQSLPGEMAGVFRWDGRTCCFRAPAHAYAAVVRGAQEAGLRLQDGARHYNVLDLSGATLMQSRPYQREAVESWRGNDLNHGGRGVVVLPTGSGKTHVALSIVRGVQRSTLVVAPTLDLVRQWYDQIRRTFDRPVGIVGGGEHTIEDLTVTTYDSAHIHTQNFGNRFGLVVFDECHHLPSDAYAFAAQGCLAPFRLGLTATPDRSDGGEFRYEDLIGPIVYRKDIVELSGKYLSDYATRRIGVHLSRLDREAYEEARAVYLGFVRRERIQFGRPDGWQQFIYKSAQSDRGRRAFEAYRRQREIAFAAPAKLRMLRHLLFEHRQDRTIVFTQDNATAYEISRRFLIPIITHQTRVRERSEILERFRSGRYRSLVTSKVLNEGVDVPEANVAVVISGSGSVREHVQRLGRILRPSEGKQAVLYELVTVETAEAQTSERRREHSAYQA